MSDPDRPWRAGDRVAQEWGGGLREGVVVFDEEPPDPMVLVRWSAASWTYVLAEELSDPPTSG